MDWTNKEAVRTYHRNYKRKRKLLGWKRSPEQIKRDKARAKIYREKNREELRLYGLKWRREHPAEIKVFYRNYRLKFEYNLTEAQYREMVVAQQNQCAICGLSGEKTHHKKLVVDHNHQTNKVRALLCHNCNLILGHTRENVEYLEKAILYLRKYQ